MVLETGGFAHVRGVKEHLAAVGYAIPMPPPQR